MLFQVYGPFRLSRDNRRKLATAPADKRLFWKTVEEQAPGLPDACGCYVFSIKSRRGSKPWYIGKSERSSFNKECFTAHKILHYKSAAEDRQGHPELLFIAQVTPNNKFRKPTTSKRRAISELESMLIGMGVSRNPALLNIRGTRMHQKLEIKGFLNTERLARTGPAKTLRDILTPG